VFARKADAVRFLTSVEADKLTGTYVDPRAGRVTFREYAEAWRSRQLWRESTMDRIESLLRNHLYPALGSVPLDAVRPSDLDRFVKGLSDKLAPSTVVGVYRLAASVFKAAVRDRILGISPCVDVRLPAKPQREVVPVTPEQVAVLADTIPHRYRALVVVGAGCGLRLGEATGLTVDRVDFLRRTVKVDRQLITPTRGEPRLGPPKRPASNRVVPLPSVVADELAAHLQRFGHGHEGLIFTTARGLPVRRNSFGGTFRQAATRAGVPLPERGGYHELRHHYASLLIASGCSVVVVQKRLGHASAQETLNTYSHLWPDDDQRTIDAVDQALGTALSSLVPTREATAEA
jgi:integrase